jgi:hypothetical protein
MTMICKVTTSGREQSESFASNAAMMTSATETVAPHVGIHGNNTLQKRAHARTHTRTHTYAHHTLANVIYMCMSLHFPVSQKATPWAMGSEIPCDISDEYSKIV